ncbi:hypothetical protein [Streptomyces sp. NBC_00536]|uniref:hypothetical protein n=1 Tax=Streptomyces sp. NBC_00536 TaxID=2975769 RepID=UPI002E81E3F6|nr:hypothetical protein [Streptomyces sp. NBC_00536]
MKETRYTEFQQAAFTAGMSSGDLLATLITRHLRDRRTPATDTPHHQASPGLTIPTQRT